MIAGAGKSLASARWRIRWAISTRSGTVGMSTMRKRAGTICKAGTTIPRLVAFFPRMFCFPQGGGVLGHNAYAYCGNSPANRRDMSGCCWEYIWDWIRSLFSDQGLENNNVIIIEEIAQINLAVVSETPAPPAPLPPVIEAYVSRAKSMIGDSYDRRDCPQLVRAAVLEYDAGFNRGARYQWSGFDDSLWKQVLEQDISKIPSGALLYYQTDEHRIVHTAIYLGCGKMIDSTDRQGIYGVSERPVDSGLTFAGKPISIVGYLYPKRLF